MKHFGSKLETESPGFFRRWRRRTTKNPVKKALASPLDRRLVQKMKPVIENPPPAAHRLAETQAQPSRVVQGKSAL